MANKSPLLETLFATVMLIGVCLIAMNILGHVTPRLRKNDSLLCYWDPHYVFPFGDVRYVCVEVKSK